MQFGQGQNSDASHVAKPANDSWPSANEEIVESTAAKTQRLKGNLEPQDHYSVFAQYDYIPGG